MKNFREVSYNIIRNNLIYRSAALSSLTDEEKNHLVNKCNIRTIIDLRSPEEHENEKDDEIEGIKNINIPLLSDEDKETKPVNVMGMTLPDMVDIYSKLVSLEKRKAWSQIFETLLNSEDGVLFHCASGKDRTGVVIAIILKALGASDDIIYKEYLLTNEQLPVEGSFRDFVMSLPEEQRKAFLNHFSAKKEYLDVVFNNLEEIYGSITIFLKAACSLNEEQIQQFKDKYMER